MFVADVLNCVLGYCRVWYLFSLRSQPLHNLLNVGALERGYRQDHPRSFHDVIELELVNELGFSNVRVEIDLVGTDEHGSRSDASIVQELMEFSLCHFELLWGGSVDDIKHNITTCSIPGPFASVLFLAANVPTFHIDSSLFENFHIQTNSWNGFDRDSMGQDGKEGGLSTIIAMNLGNSNRRSCFDCLSKKVGR